MSASFWLQAVNALKIAITDSLANKLPKYGDPRHSGSLYCQPDQCSRPPPLMPER